MLETSHDSIDSLGTTSENAQDLLLQKLLMIIILIFIFTNTLIEGDNKRHHYTKEM